MMQINRKLEIICQSNYLPMKLSSDEIICQLNYLPMKLSANDADQQEVGNYLPISANVRSQGYHLNFGILKNGPSFSCSI